MTQPLHADPALAALLAAVVADPGDDLARLAYADRCDELGDPGRAEFVRAQIHADRRGIEDGLIAQATLAARGAAWRDEALRGLPWMNWVTGFRRGFVAEVRLSLEDFVAHAAALFARCPVEEVLLTDRHPYLLSGEGVPTRRVWGGWPDEGYLHHADCLPWPLFRLLGGGSLHGGPVNRPHCRAYEAEAEAWDALSRACVRFGRAAAGLPLLP